MKIILATIAIILILLACTLILDTCHIIAPKRDYQIDITTNSIFLWDGKNFIGKYGYKNTSLDSLICKNNQ